MTDHERGCAWRNRARTAEDSPRCRSGAHNVFGFPFGKGSSLGIQYLAPLSPRRCESGQPGFIFQYSARTPTESLATVSRQSSVTGLQGPWTAVVLKCALASFLHTACKSGSLIRGCGFLVRRCPIDKLGWIRQRRDDGRFDRQATHAGCVCRGAFRKGKSLRMLSVVEAARR